MATHFVCSSPGRGHCVRHFTLTVYKWVRANLMLVAVTLRRTSIPSRVDYGSYADYSFVILTLFL